MDIQETDREREGFELSASLAFRVSELGRLMTRALAARLADHGVAPGQFVVLMALHEQDPRSVTELAAALAVEHPTVSRTLSRMERAGLVRRSRDPLDQRSRLVSLTERGQRLRPELEAAASAVNAEFLAPLDVDQGAQLLALLRAVIEPRTSNGHPS